MRIYPDCVANFECKNFIRIYTITKDQKSPSKTRGVLPKYWRNLGAIIKKIINSRSHATSKANSINNQQVS